MRLFFAYYIYAYFSCIFVRVFCIFYVDKSRHSGDKNREKRGWDSCVRESRSGRPFISLGPPRVKLKSINSGLRNFDLKVNRLVRRETSFCERGERTKRRKETGGRAFETARSRSQTFPPNVPVSSRSIFRVSATICRQREDEGRSLWKLNPAGWTSTSFSTRSLQCSSIDASRLRSLWGDYFANSSACPRYLPVILFLLRYVSVAITRTSSKQDLSLDGSVGL